MTANDPSYAIRLSEQQRSAVDRVVAWYDDVVGFQRALDEGLSWDRKSQIQSLVRCTLGGFAGTGKTTIVKWIALELGVNVGICALTGKAAYVLRQKGLAQATTMHRLMYDPVASCEGCGMAASDFPENPQHWCPHRVVSVNFERKAVLPYDLVIVDEASMVNRTLMDDLERFGVPVLYVGDHGQLEPIGENPRLMVNPDIRLETIHRQAEGSEILQLAHMVRQGRTPETTGPKAQVVRASTMPRDAPSYDVVICGFNADRVAINNWVRRRHGRTGPPMAGDRVVCLRNDHDHGIFNGMLGTLRDVRVRKSSNGYDVPVLDVEDDLGQCWESLDYAPEQFGAEATLREIRKEKTLWDFGYALTCHKCQGSEFDRVLVLEQIAPKWESARWRYTAITRAADEIVYCVNERRRR